MSLYDVGGSREASPIGGEVLWPGTRTHPWDRGGS